MAQLIVFMNVELPVSLQAIFACLYAFCSGNVLRYINIETYIIRSKLFAFASSIVILVLINSIGTISLGNGRIINILFFTATSIAGWIICYLIAKTLPSAINRILAYIGERSIWILLFHFAAFKIVTFCINAFRCDDISSLYAFPVYDDVNAVWKMAYIIIGVAIPLMIGYAFQKIHLLMKAWINTKTA